MAESRKLTSRRESALLFTITFLGGASYIMTRTVAIGLFLAREGSEPLPILLGVSAISVIAISALGRRVAVFTSAKRFAIGSCLLLAMISLVLLLLIIPFHHSAIALGALYVLAEIRGSTNTVNMVSLTSETFADSFESRPYAIVASGAPVAGIVVGVIVGIEASALGAISLLVASIITDLASGLVVSMLRLSNQRQQPIPKVQPLLEEKNSLVYRRHLSFLFLLKVIVLTLIGFQWKVAVGDYFGEDEARLVAYFAFFYAATDLLVIIIQWLGFGYLHDRFGMIFSLCSFPALLAVVGTVSLFFDTTLALMVVFTVGKGLTVMRRAIHDPALNAAYTLLRSGVRRDTILSITGILKPMAEALTAGILLSLTGFFDPIYMLSIVWLTLVPMWLYFSIGTARMHQSMTAMASQ